MTGSSTGWLVRPAGLPIVRRVVQKPLASLPGDDVDHGALHVAELGGRADGLDLHFLNEVDARLGSRDAVARAREVRAVDEKLVLVGAGAERGHAGRGGRRAARGEVGEMPGAALIEVEHAEAPRRDRLEVLRAEARLESAVPRFDARARALDATDSASPASFSTTVLSMVAPAPMRMSSS